MKLTTGGVTVNIELEPVTDRVLGGPDNTSPLAKNDSTAGEAILAKGTGTSDTVTEIDRLLAKADATTDICLRAGYREKAALLRGAS